MRKTQLFENTRGYTHNVVLTSKLNYRENRVYKHTDTHAITFKFDSRSIYSNIKAITTRNRYCSAERKICVMMLYVNDATRCAGVTSALYEIG